MYCAGMYRNKKSTSRVDGNGGCLGKGVGAARVGQRGVRFGDALPDVLA